MLDLFGEEFQEKKRGGGESVYHIIGASNHCAESRADEDFYATPPVATEMLCSIERFSHEILEPCCGQGHIAKVLAEQGYSVTARDLVDRGYGDEHGVDFLDDNRKWGGDVVTNPPYNMAQKFVEHALEIVGVGHKVAMFLKLTFAEGKGRRVLFDSHPPPTGLGFVGAPWVRQERYGVDAVCRSVLLVDLAERLYRIDRNEVV